MNLVELLLHQIVSSGLTHGRPQKTCIESSQRTKRRKTKDLRSNELADLIYSTQMKLRETRKADASKILKDTSN